MAVISEEYEKGFDQHKTAFDNLVVRIVQNNELGDKTKEFLDHFDKNKEFLNAINNGLKKYLKTRKEEDKKKLSNIIIRCFEETTFHLEKMRNIVENSNHPKKEAIKKVINDFIADILNLWSLAEKGYE